MNRALTLACALLVAAVDQVTKRTAEVQLGALPEGQAAVLVPDLLYLKATTNPSGVWGAFEGLSAWIFVAVSIVFVMFTTALILRLSEADRAYLPALGLVLGGFLGNGIDRVRLGAVNDFIHFDGYPAWIVASFNLADVAILVGVVSIAIRYLFTRRRAGDRPPDAPAEAT